MLYWHLINLDQPKKLRMKTLTKIAVILLVTFGLQLNSAQNQTSKQDEEKYSLNILRGKEPETFETDVAYLRALASIDTGQFSEAVKILQSLRKEKSLEGFVLYNLGIALIQNGNEEEGLAVGLLPAMEIL